MPKIIHLRSEHKYTTIYRESPPWFKIMNVGVHTFKTDLVTTRKGMLPLSEGHLKLP